MQLALPVLLGDVDHRMSEWGTEGKINPFKEVYDVSGATPIFVALTHI